MSFLRFISNFHGYGSKVKNIIFAIFLFCNLQYARKLDSFVQRCVKVLTGKTLRNNTVPAIFTKAEKPEPEKKLSFLIFYTYEHLNSMLS